MPNEKNNKADNAKKDAIFYMRIEGDKKERARQLAEKKGLSLSALVDKLIEKALTSN